MKKIRKKTKLQPLKTPVEMGEFAQVKFRDVQTGETVSIAATEEKTLGLRELGRTLVDINKMSSFIAFEVGVLSLVILDPPMGSFGKDFFPAGSLNAAAYRAFPTPDSYKGALAAFELFERRGSLPLGSPAAEGESSSYYTALDDREVSGSVLVRNGVAEFPGVSFRVKAAA